MAYVLELLECPDGCMSLEAFFDKFEMFADAPNGVPKLRELILQLAVQGKLVPQHPDDGSASDLIEILKRNKMDLIKEKAIRAGNDTTPSVTLHEPHFVPSNWRWCKISDFAIVRGGKRLPKGAAFSEIPTPHIYIQVTNMKKGTIIKDDLKYIDRDVYAQICQYTIDSDDIYITIAGTIGVSGEVPEFFNGMNLTENAAKLIFRGLNKHYLLISLNSETLQKQFNQKTNQMAQPKLALKRIGDSLIPLPPVNEQNRIVAKVDELMRLCDELEQWQQAKRKSRLRLNNATLAPFNEPVSLEPAEFEQAVVRMVDNFDTLYNSIDTVVKLRPTILQLAVQGKLGTENPKDEPAAGLLEKISQQNETDDSKKRQRSQGIAPVMNTRELPFAVPSKWEWTRLGGLTALIEYGTSEKASLDEKGVPVFRMNNIESGEVLQTNLKYVPSSIKDLPRLYLKTNDILFNRTNSFELVGKTGIFKGQSDKFTFASYLIRIRLFDSFVSPEYVNLAMNADYFRVTQINTEVTQQCGQANFNGTKLANTLIPLPPLAEQNRIVAKVNQLMSLCDELEAKLRQAETNGEKLMNAAVQHVLKTISHKSNQDRS